MNNVIKQVVCVLVVLSSHTMLCAQSVNDAIEQKIYDSDKMILVVLVLCVIFTGIVVYLFSIDRKISKLEKEIEKNQNQSK